MAMDVYEDILDCNKKISYFQLLTNVYCKVTRCVIM